MPMTVEIDSKLRRVFYPTVLLLICLPLACQYPYRARREIDQSPHSSSTPEHKFRDFVSKLAFLCWSDLSPAAISACAVLKQPDDTVEYAFAFNNRSPIELARLEGRIESILLMFNQPPPFSKDRKREILRHVLTCNVNRVRGYLKSFERHLDDCIQACARDAEADDELKACLEALRTATSQTLKYSGDRVEVNIPETELLILRIHAAYKGPVFTHVQERVRREERLRSSEHWTELVHVVGRLMTYKQAIDVAAMVSEEWPELFRNFHITMVPSSAPASQVLNGRALTAAQIIQKSTAIVSDADLIREFHAQAQNLQAHGLDDKIKEEWSKKQRQISYVHAEMQLLRWLETTEGGIDESRFFEGIKFIGTSKPPCKLCWYFFKAYAPDVEVRMTHWNPYLNWRLPDMPAPDAARVIHRLRGNICDDLKRALTSKERDGRPHDSSNYSTRQGAQSHEWRDDASVTTHFAADSDDMEATEPDPVDTLPGRSVPDENSATLRYLSAQASLDDVLSPMSALSLRSGQPEPRRAQAVPHRQPQVNARRINRTVAVVETDDEEDGGTLLFRGRQALLTEAVRT